MKHKKKASNVSCDMQTKAARQQEVMAFNKGELSRDNLLQNKSDADAAAVTAL